MKNNITRREFVRRLSYLSFFIFASLYSDERFKFEIDAISCALYDSEDNFISDITYSEGFTEAVGAPEPDIIREERPDLFDDRGFSFGHNFGNGTINLGKWLIPAGNATLKFKANTNKSVFIDYFYLLPEIKKNNVSIVTAPLHAIGASGEWVQGLPIVLNLFSRVAENPGESSQMNLSIPISGSYTVYANVWHDGSNPHKINFEIGNNGETKLIDVILPAGEPVWNNVELGTFQLEAGDAIIKFTNDASNPPDKIVAIGEFVIVPREVAEPMVFDTGAGTYPSIFGTHNGTITPNQTIAVHTLYTYPCEGTGGHSEYVRIWNLTWNVTASWNGYKGDWHNISFVKNFTLVANETYNYTIRTGSYPQIHHANALPTATGWINCTKFVDANGQVYYDRIPAIRLE